jgi:hypothetical protein
MISEDLIKSEVERAEIDTGRKFLRQTWIAYVSDWWSYFTPLSLPYGNISIDSIYYYSEDDTEYLLSTDIYGYAPGMRASNGYVYKKQDQDWPSVTLRDYRPIKITFQCGWHYGDGWEADTVVALDTIVVPTSLIGLAYKCTANGTTDSTEPDWPLTLGETVVDNTVTWTCVGETLPPALRRAILIGILDSYDQPGDLLFYPNKNLLDVRMNLIQKWRLL